MFGHFTTLCMKGLTLSVPISQNGQTHSNNSSANCRRIAGVCLTIFVGLALKGLIHNSHRKSSFMWQKYMPYPESYLEHVFKNAQS